MRWTRLPGSILQEGGLAGSPAVAFSPDGKTLKQGERVVLWDPVARKRVAGGLAGIRAVAFSPDGKTLATGTKGRLRLWRGPGWKQATVITTARPCPDALAFSPDGKTLVSGEHDGKIKLWNASTGRVVASFQAHNESVQSIAFSPDGRALAFGLLGG